MMKKLIISMLFVSSLISVQLLAEDKSGLEGKLDDLRIPDNKVTPVLSRDQLYIVNTRYSSLRNRHEVTLLGSHNFTADSHLDTKHAGATYRYHLNSDWNFGLRYNRYTNKLTSAGSTLFENEQLLPDTDFALESQEIFATYNTIYGKLRWSKDTVVYFDQYISVGAGSIELASGRTNHGLVDLGLAFWIGKHASVRVGLRNEFFNQTQFVGDRFRINSMGYLEIGYIFGTGDRG
jgi:outer membrane beta-barrel protein